MGRGSTNDAERLRRPGHRTGSVASEKSKPGGGLLKKASAPPTFSTFAGVTPRQIASEFAQLRKLKPRLSKAVGHLILSPGPGDRTLSKEEWKAAMDIALAEHGATDALYASYLHENTDHQHLHIFFSRILPSGQVVSDSLSYQRNRSASKKITQELKLTPLPTTPSPTAPGDRAALNNAALSAKRRGDALPRPEVVRLALQQSRRRAEYYSHLRAAGIEMDCAIRGQKNEIFGTSMRVIGSEAWVKSSTIAKDLSWPKVKGRFPESDWFLESHSAEKSKVTFSDEVTQIAPEAPEAPKAPEASPAPRATRLDQDRMPAVARNILVPPVKESDTAFNAVSRRLGELGEQQSSPLLMTGLVIAKLGVMCLQLSAAAARALWAFIRRLLAAFGVGVREVRVTTPAAPLQLAPVVTPPPATTQVLQQPYLLPQANTIDSVDSVAAATLEHVLDCVQTGRVSDLPKIGDGQENERVALVAALAHDSTATRGALSAGAGAAATPGAAPDRFEPLFTAMSSYTTAKHAHDVAPKVESVEVRNARVKVGMASQNLLKSQTRFQREHPNLFLLGRMKKHTVEETAAVAEAQRAFHQAKIDFPHAADISLIADANRKAMAFLLLARKAVQHLKDQRCLIRDQQISKYASSPIARLQKAITEFKNGNGEETISMVADRSLSEVNKFVEDDRSQSRRKEINARLAASAEESTAAAAAAAAAAADADADAEAEAEAAGDDGDEEPPRG